MATFTKTEAIDTRSDVLAGLEMIAGKLARAAQLIEAIANDFNEAQDLDELARTYALTKIATERVETERKKLDAVLDKVSKHDLPPLMLLLNRTPFTLADINRRFQINTRMSAKITDKEAAMKWLRDNGHGDLIQETVNSSALASFAKEYVEQTQCDLPTDAFDCKNYSFATAVKV